MLLLLKVTKSTSPPWAFFTFFKFYKWYQIAQRITYVFFQKLSQYQERRKCNSSIFSDTSGYKLLLISFWFSLK